MRSEMAPFLPKAETRQVWVVVIRPKNVVCHVRRPNVRGVYEYAGHSLRAVGRILPVTDLSDIRKRDTSLVIERGVWRD